MTTIRTIATIVLACVLGACAKTAPAGERVARTVELGNPASSSDGARIYLTNCSSCHQPDGEGLPGAFPPLAGNSVVTGDARRPIAIVAFGLRGKIEAEGRAYDGVMPAWHGLLSDDDIAAVVTYIRFAWHNRASPVTRGQVEALQKLNR